MALATTISTLFAIPLLTAAIWIALIVQSLLFPTLRVWPVPVPAQRAISLRTRLNRSTGLVTGLSALCLVFLGVLDFDSLQLGRPVHLGVGVALFLAGGCLAGMGFLTLGPEISTGASPDTVQRAGPYRISRNPQYVGTVAVLLGFGLLANSSLCIVASLGWCVWFLFAPFAEEAFLRSQMGAAYESYVESTRRYL